MPEPTFITPTSVQLQSLVVQPGGVIAEVVCTFGESIVLTGIPAYSLLNYFVWASHCSGAAPHIVSPPGVLVNYARLRFQASLTLPLSLVLFVPSGDMHILGVGGAQVTPGYYPVGPFPPVPPIPPVPPVPPVPPIPTNFALDFRVTINAVYTSLLQ